MTKPVFFISSMSLEPWDWRNPWTKGIGGSETSHIEMAYRLANRGYKIKSYTPVEKPSMHNKVPYRHVDEAVSSKNGLYIWYRDPIKFDLDKHSKAKWWFIAQDVDYEGLWTKERLAKVDRYICLSKDHKNYTESKYPELRGRVYISSNGIRSNSIRLRSQVKRNYNRLFFPSSPDRGIKLILENWFRIREINPKAEIYVAYGFDNMEAIVKLAGTGDWRYQYQIELQQLAKQPGVYFVGRQNQHRIYEYWRGTNIWAHPTDFPETSCITSMEAQALGAWPVTNNLWALRENVNYGWMVQGIPQKSELVRTNWLHALEQAFHCRDEKTRKEMQEWALERFDWEKVVNQWDIWIKEDM